MTKAEQLAEAMGYTVDKSGGGRIFIKGDKHVWQCYGGWKRATFKDGEYSDWFVESYLADALTQNVQEN
jgi:hypothetical protein